MLKTIRLPLALLSYIYLASGAHAFGVPPEDPNLTNYQPYFAPAQTPSGPAQIGLTPDIAKQGKYGKGVVIGHQDTGIDVDDAQFAGRISAQSGCYYTGVNGCYQGIDNPYNAHGNKSAAIIAGKTGVAPLATLLVKVADQRNGEPRFGAFGASVINYSLAGVLYDTPKLNDEARNHAVSVVAGANDSRSYFVSGTVRYGFAPEVFSHLIAVGAVNASNQLTNISNTPGNAILSTAATQGMAGTTIPLKNLWLVAPANATSWAAPQVTGALALLMARWPVLKTNGQATSVLFSTAQDLGAPGIDEVYGNGLLRIDRAFQPVGQLMVYSEDEHMVPINTMSAYMRSSVPTGSLPDLVNILNYFANTFDQFGRDFKIDWAPLIMPASSATAQTSTIPNQTPTVQGVGFADGSTLAFGKMETVGDGVEAPGITTGQNWFASFTDASGVTLAAGQGFPASMSFASAMYGSDRDLADQSSSLGAVNALASVAQGGGFAAFGTKVGKDTNLAFGWSSTQATNSITGDSWAMPDANSFSAGLTTQVTKGWKAGVTLGMLSEKDGMLGATYAPDSPISFGNDNRSFSLGVSSGISLTNKTSLLLEASMAKTSGSSNLSGLITDTSDITTRSFGASIAHKDAFDKGDRLELSVKAPLKVVSGSAGVMLSNVDEDGNVSLYSKRASLRPDGNELNFGVAYKAPVTETFEWNGSLNYRHDADNIAGNSETVGMVKATIRF